ncbi:MAG TPA: hypothetical protein VF262_11705 [Burkholderiales bacterium]
MRLLLALFLAAVAGFAHAEDTVGRVRAVYYEAARGVLVEARMSHAASAIRWADVEAGSRRLLVQLPGGFPAAPGDLVAVRLADPKTSPLAQVLPAVAVNRAVDGGGASSVGR